MKKQKAIKWEKISEGIVTSEQIEKAQASKRSIELVLLSALNQNVAGTIEIVPVRGPAFRVDNNLSKPPVTISKKPYKYLSCAVRCAVKEYKAALRSGIWRMLTK